MIDLDYTDLKKYGIVVKDPPRSVQIVYKDGHVNQTTYLTVYQKSDEVEFAIQDTELININNLSDDDKKQIIKKLNNAKNANALRKLQVDNIIKLLKL